MNPARIELDPAIRSAAAARGFVAGQMRTASERSDLVADMQLAVSELVTNAVEHGDAGRIVVALEVDKCVLRLSVSSRSRTDGVPPISGWAVAGPDEVTGRGLGIVHALADHVSVQRGGGCLTVTVERRLG